MTYLVKEIFLTLHGEGIQAVSPAVFCRFTCCNLWTGREEHRDQAVCQFCDTDFVGTDGEGGGKFATADDLADHIAATWTGDDDASRLVVCTGGEPLLQLDQELVDALHARRFRIAIETNGTLLPPDGIDWICMSPKAGADLVLTEGDELKLVFPQPGLLPETVEHLAFDHRFLQPMDGPDRAANTEAAIAHCLAHPRWRLSVQTHKYLGIP
ncbi:MAG: 7-carboxy-7-deazaguanine synthase [Aquihabitans sp.]